MRIPTDMDIEVNFFVRGVPERKIEQVAFRSIPLDEAPDGQVASRVINALDKTGYSREQVHAIAHWVLYLSTQS